MHAPPPGSRSRLRDQAGIGFVSLLLALLIAAALYFGYFKMQQVSGERSSGIAAIDASRAVACRANRQTIERAIGIWAINHPDEQPSIAALEADGVRLPTCPEGGQYAIVGRDVRCNRHP